MALHELAPSIAPLAGTDRPPVGAPAPKDRLTVLLGAGASLYAGAPSTNDLTNLVGETEIGEAILRELRSNDATNGANFEDVLHVLEEIDTLLGASNERAPTMLRAFIAPSRTLSAIASNPALLRRERFELLEKIASAFDAIDYNLTWRPLYHLLRPLLHTFDIDVFTLNYDQVADVAVYGLSVISGKKCFDGFGGPINMEGSASFRPDQYALWDPAWGPVHLTLAHLHGSLRFAYHKSDQRMAHSVRYELVQAQGPKIARETWRWATIAATEDPLLDFGGVLPVVSGLRKLEKLNVQPYANYYVAFAHAVSASPLLLIVGYGAGDEHINYWLREYTLIHGDKARAVEVTRSDDCMRFTMQRFGAYDLRWAKVPANADAFVSRAGIRCLTITGGLTADRSFDGRLEHLISAQYSGDLRY